MSDITSKLRDGIADLVRQEAAREIDRLRAELAGYVEANRYMKGELDDALEDARKYAEAKGEIARLREALGLVVAYDEMAIDCDSDVALMLAYADALDACRAALAQVAEVGR